MKTRMLVLGLLSLFLLGCGQKNVRGDSPSTDLKLMRIGVKHLTEKRQIEGAVQHRDEATDNGQLWNYAGRLEDKSSLDDGDKDRTRAYVFEALDALEASRLPPCPTWNLACKWRRSRTPEP